MDEAIQIGPSVILFISWLLLRSKKYRQEILLSIWVGLISILVFIGWSANPGTEATKTAVVLLCTSTIWFSGPFLIYSLGKQWKYYWSLIACIILPFVSSLICIFLMLGLGQIWGL